jgi:hypothetical protein
MAHEDARQLKHQPPDCTDPATPGTCAVTSPTPYRRLPDPCGDVALPDPCVPGVFIAPPGVPYIAPTAPISLPFVFVFNALRVAQCADLVPAPGGTVIGSAVTVLAEALTSGVPVSVVTDVTPTQRQTLASLSQSTLNGFAALTELQIAGVTGFSLAQATELKDAIDAEIAILNAQALSQAFAGLNCYYRNTQQTASCPDDSSTSPVVVSANIVTSYVSQADADAQALAQAQAGLRCEWVNAEQIARCAVDATGGSPTTVTIDVGSVTSAVSKADANAQALAQAESQIVCLYPNTEQTVTCDDVAPDADVTANNPVVIAAGTVLSSVSVDDANEQALVAGQLLLQCQWSNTLQAPVVCPNNGGQAASETASPVYSVQPAAGSFISTLSRADANALALAFATAQLDCRYCNTLIEALCDDPAGSDDATAAVPAGSFCESTYDAAQSLAGALAAIPIAIQVSGTPTCHYTNDRITSGCVGTDGAYEVYKFATGSVAAGSSGTVIVDAGSVTSVVSKADANTQAKALALAFLNCFFDSAESAPTSCSSDAATGSYPPYGAPLTLPTGFFTSYTSQAEANSLRDTYLASVLSCFWKNDATTVWCDGTAATEAITPKNAVIPVNTLVSLVSKVDVNALATALATASLVCFYTNDAKTGAGCGVGTTQMQTGSVSAGTLTAGSKASANSLAQTLANALNVCVADSFLITLGGAPGSQGPSGSCATPCGAFYA